MSGRKSPKRPPAAQQAAPPALEPSPPGIPPEIRARLQYVFWMLAKSDNRHDFSSIKMKEVFDAIPLESIQTFQNRVVAVASLRLQSAELTIYRFFKDHIYKIFSDNNLYPREDTPGPDGTSNVVDEIKTIDYMLGKDMQIIKNMLTSSKDYNYLEDIQKTNKNLNGVLSRNYVVNAVRYKNKHKRSCLSKAIKTLISNNNRITLIVDASNLKMTEIRSNSEEDYVNTPANPLSETVGEVKKKYVDFSGDAQELAVNLLFSSENKSDSAGKIGYESYVEAVNKNVKISVFEDIQETLSYPTFTSGDSSQNANIYASIPFTTHRGSGTQAVRGEFIINEETKVIIDDLKNESQIASASFKAVQLYLEAYGRGQVDDVKMKEILVQFLIKRIGDWSQGLCLLDLYRMYRFIQGEGDKKADHTLEDIKGSGEMGVLTHDQVLLSYCMLIGVDVFFTVHFPTGDHWLLHFKNDAAEGKTTKAKIDEEVEALSALDASIEAEIDATRKYVAEITAEINALPSVATFRKYIEGLYVTSSNLQNHTSLAKLEELKVSLANVKEIIDGKIVDGNKTGGTTEYDRDGQRKLLSSSILRNRINSTIAENTKIRNTREITGREKDALDNLINAIRRGGNVTVTIAYQNYMEKLVYPIRDAIKAIKATGIKYPSRETPLDASSFEIAAGTRVAYISDNLKNLQKTLDIITSTGQSGGGRKALEDIFYDIRDRSIIVFKKHEITSEDDITNVLPPIVNVSEPSLLAARAKENEHESSLENFKAIQGEYVSDRNMNFYSVLDRYIITEDDRHKFDHLDAVTEPDRSTYPYNYCILRRLLLNHDKLYSKYIKLKAEYAVDLEDTETSIYRDLEGLYSSVEKLGKAAKSEISAKTSKNRDDITYAIGRRLAYIRYNIFKSYMSKSKEAKYSYLKLDEIEMKEAADILSTLREDDPLKRDYQEFKEIDKQEQEAICALAGLRGEGCRQVAGGRRRTRRAKKHPKRKTRRHKK
jgi:hypothetical protein